jgi:hypothetical protein
VAISINVCSRRIASASGGGEVGEWGGLVVGVSELGGFGVSELGGVGVSGPCEVVGVVVLVVVGVSGPCGWCERVGWLV